MGEFIHVEIRKDPPVLWEWSHPETHASEEMLRRLLLRIKGQLHEGQGLLLQIIMVLTN